MSLGSLDWEHFGDMVYNRVYDVTFAYILRCGCGFSLFRNRMQERFDEWHGSSDMLFVCLPSGEAGLAPGALSGGMGAIVKLISHEGGSKRGRRRGRGDLTLLGGQSLLDH